MWTQLRNIYCYCGESCVANLTLSNLKFNQSVASELWKSHWPWMLNLKKKKGREQRKEGDEKATNKKATNRGDAIWRNPQRPKIIEVLIKRSKSIKWNIDHFKAVKQDIKISVQWSPSGPKCQQLWVRIISWLEWNVRLLKCSYFFKEMVHSRPLFLYFTYFQYSWQ